MTWRDRLLVVLCGAVVGIALVLALSGCTDGGGYAPAPVVYVHHTETHVHVYVPPRPRVVIRPRTR